MSRIPQELEYMTEIIPLLRKLQEWVNYYRYIMIKSLRVPVSQVARYEMKKFFDVYVAYLLRKYYKLPYWALLIVLDTDSSVVKYRRLNSQFQTYMKEKNENPCFFLVFNFVMYIINKEGSNGIFCEVYKETNSSGGNAS
jgi:hypothetical protein